MWASISTIFLLSGATAIKVPTSAPIPAPTLLPTLAPMLVPTSAPTPAPTLLPKLAPMLVPTSAPTPAPTLLPTLASMPVPTSAPTPAPTLLPTLASMPVPTSAPTPAPTLLPTLAPMLVPTSAPIPAPTLLPTLASMLVPTFNVDIIGYYNFFGLNMASGDAAGDAVSGLTLDKIHPNYNILIITFAYISDSGQWSLEVSGPYNGHLDQLAADVPVWKEKIDSWDRRKAALVSVGNHNGGWPSGVSLSVLLEGLWGLFHEFHLDGLDIDLAGTTLLDAASADSLAGVIKNLTLSGKLVTGSPGASQYSLNHYASILPLLSWVQPQFYNNGPISIATPYLPPADVWPTPWKVMDWQEEQGGEPFWAGVLDAIADAHGLVSAQKGMLAPASTIAAAAYNDWDMKKLAIEVANSGITHVGTWSIAHDLLTDWAFSTAIGALNGKVLHSKAPSMIPTSRPSMIPTLSPSPMSRSPSSGSPSSGSPSSGSPSSGSPSPSSKVWTSEAITLGAFGLLFLGLAIAFAFWFYVKKQGNKSLVIKQWKEYFSTKSKEKKLGVELDEEKKQLDYV